MPTSTKKPGPRKPAIPAPVAVKPVKAVAVAAKPVVKAVPKPVAKIIPKPLLKPVVTATVLKPNFPQLKRSIMAPTTFKGFEDFTSFGKEAYDAMMKANAMFTKGIEDFGKEMMTLTQTGMETASSHTKAIMSAKSLKEVVELNTEFTKSSIEKMVASSTKLSELGMKVTTEALAPISARLKAA